MTAVYQRTVYQRFSRIGSRGAYLITTISNFLGTRERLASFVTFVKGGCQVMLSVICDFGGGCALQLTAEQVPPNSLIVSEAVSVPYTAIARALMAGVQAEPKRAKQPAVGSATRRGKHATRHSSRKVP